MIWMYLVAIGLIVGGIIAGSIGFFRAFRKSKSILHYKNIIDILTLKKRKKKVEVSDVKGIKHYEAMRDNLTGKNEEEEISTGSGFSISSIIGGIIAVIIGVSLIGPVSEQVKIAASSSAAMNVSTPASDMTQTMLTLIPVFFAVAVLGIGIAVAFNAFRSAGAV